MNTSTISDYEAALVEWVDGLTLRGKSGRRAVFVERSLKRNYKTMIHKAATMKQVQVPMNWTKGLDAFKFLTLWQLTVNISRKFKAEIPEQFKFRKLLAEL